MHMCMFLIAIACMSLSALGGASSSGDRRRVESRSVLFWEAKCRDKVARISIAGPSKGVICQLPVASLPPPSFIISQANAVKVFCAVSWPSGWPFSPHHKSEMSA